MKWLTNIYDPRLPDARDRYLYTTDDHAAEWNTYRQWLSDKHIGLPEPSGTLTVEQLQKQNYVGVYKI